MGQLRNFVTPYHKRAKDRDYLHRMTDDKIHCMEIARKYEQEYWDGDRRYGYGGYRYDGRWKPFAQMLIDTYKLPEDAKILDVGCGKAFILHELGQLLPKAEIVGFDVSKHGIGDAPEATRPMLFNYRAQDPYPYGDKYFDLVLSMTCLHNLQIFELKTALQEIERVGKNKYVSMESYRNCAELFNVQCWALTCEAWFRPEAWIWMFREFGYTGDYEFIYFE